MASELWSSDRNSLLLRKMSTTGTELLYFYIDEPNPRDLATDDSALWLATSEGRLIKYTFDGVVVDSIIGLLPSAWGLTWVNNYLWVSDPVNDSIYKIRLPQYEDITPDSVKNWMDSGADLVILDVREPYEFESYGRIPGALNLPWNSGVLDTAYTQLSPDDTIIVACGSGYRSVLASKFLDENGFEIVYNMLGGMNAWHHSVEVGGNISVNATWGTDKNPFIAVSDIIVDNSKTLSLEPGAKIEFGGYYSLEVYGNLLAQGTLDSNIHFTSHDSLPGGWEGIRIFEGSSSSFNYCRIDSSGNGIRCVNSSPAIENSWISGSQTSIYLSGSNAVPEILNCVLQGSSGILILCDSSSAPVITYSSIMDGMKGVVTRNGANPQVNYNNIYNNSEYGLSNEDSSVIINAQNNWWGDKSGPYDPTGNPDGQGNRVSRWVDYIPWLQIEAPYVCGDANSDTTVSVSDVVYLINYMFKGGPAPAPLQVADVNGDSQITVSDAVYLINYLFKGGDAPCQ